MIIYASAKNGLKAAGNVRYVIPSAISVVRVLLAILLVTEVVSWPAGMLLAPLIGVPIVFILDAVDGIVARRLNSQTLLGSFIDIAADRAVEFVFLQYFVSAGLVPLWFVLIFYGRIVLTDACRIRAFAMEKVSINGILLSQPWRVLVLSKLSRSGYGTIKGVLFGVLLLGMDRGDMSHSLLEFSLLVGVLAFSIVRAVPILITYFPRRRELIKVQGEEHLEGHNIATLTTRFVSWMELALDICLAAVLVMLSWR